MRKKDAEKGKKNGKETTQTGGFDAETPANETGAQTEEEFFNKEYRTFAEDDTEFQKQPDPFFFAGLGKKLDKLVIAVKNKVSACINQLRRLKTKTEKYKLFVCADSTKRALAVGKLYLMKLLAHLKPTKIGGRVTYGTGDPASTGEQLGMLSAFLPLYADKIDITPDFSQKILSGDVFIKGRVRVYNILYYALKVYFNKYVKHSVAYFKKISGGTKEWQI